MTGAIEQAFAAGAAAVGQAVASSPDALTIDWRNSAAAIAADVAAISAKHGTEFDFDGMLDAEMTAIDALPMWNAALLPEVEIRVLRSTVESDTRIVLIRPSAWWRTMTARHREVLHAVFAPLPAPAVKGGTNQVRRGKRSPTAAALRYPGEWISDPARGPALRDRAQAQLLDALRSPLGVGRAVGSMRQLGTFYQLAGQAAVLAGDATGWQMVRLGFRFAATAVHLSDRLFVADPRPDKPPRTDEWQVGHCVALGLALDVPATDRTFEIFQRRMQSGTLGAGRGAFARYLAALCQLHVGSSDANELEACDLGPWHELFAAWESDARFAAAMLAALAYHVERATPSSRHPGEFEGGPEQAFAAELVAVTRMREANGLVTPFVDHVLWQTPLVATRPTGPWPEDELLSRCIAFADEVQPPHPDELLAAIPNPGVRGGLGSRLRRTFSRWFGGTS